MSLAPKTSLIVRDLTLHGCAGSGSNHPLILTIHQEGPVASKPRALPNLPVTDRSPVEEPSEGELLYPKNPKLVLDAVPRLRDLGEYQPAGILFGQHRSMVPRAIHSGPPGTDSASGMPPLQGFDRAPPGRLWAATDGCRRQSTTTVVIRPR